MSFASLRRVLRSARKGLCSTCAKTKHPQLEAAGAGHVGCLIYTFETLGEVVTDEHDVTALHVAARKGQISILIYLMENDLVEGVPRAKNGATPAHDAAGTGHLECLQYILSRTKASALDKDVNQATPLHWAVQSGRFKVVQWLVMKANAPIDSAANNGVTPFHIAAAKNYLEILRWLTGHAYRHYPKPRRLINAKDRNGATPLYHSAHAGHLQVIQWLAEKGGGDPTIFTSQGLAPLHAATMSGHLECVTYLFRFGSATAPGGLRSTEGASALHYAAADGHTDIMKWLLRQKECTGNERDYYQCTPLHDAAEHGHLKAIQLLCEAGADHLLTDIEGNFPKDLAEKHHHAKCAKFLASLQKRKVSKGKNDGGSTTVPQSGKGLRRQQKTTTADMIDNYRNAPPHQRPVNVFDEEEDEFESMGGDRQWETLHDLMDKSELEQLSPSEGAPVLAADKKRRNLEENMRREAEERKKKKRELLRREQEYEKEIRDRLLAEEPLESREWVEVEGSDKKGKRRRKSEEVNKAQRDMRRLSLPAKLTSEDMTQKGIVEKRTWEFESRTPVGTGARSTLLSKLWPGRKTISAPAGVTHSKSWDGSIATTVDHLTSSQDSLHVIDAMEEELPVPPPLPTMEYLLGKRPSNLRGKGHSPHSKHATDSRDEGSEDNSDIDSDHSSVSSTQSDSRTQQKKKGKKKKKKSPKEDDVFDWQYSQLTVPHSSPPRERKKIMTRRPTPPPNLFKPVYGLSNDVNHAFDEVSRQLEMDSLSESPSSLSPLHSPSPKSPVSPPNHVSPSHNFNQVAGQANNKATSRPVPKRAAPKLPPHLQNKQGMQSNQATSSDQKVIKTTPISQKGSSRTKAPLRQQQQPQQTGNAPIGNPDMFMAVLNEVISSSPKQPRIMRQLGHQPSPPEYRSPPPSGVDLQLDMMRTMVANRSNASGHLPSPEPERSESDSESSEYSSSSDDSTSSSDDGSSSEDSSDEESGLVRPQVPKRPIMARNIGMGSPRRGLGGISRAKMMARYPRLLRKKPIRLQTILEVPEELVHEAETQDEQAVVFHRLSVEKKIMKAWRRYMQIMKTIYRKAEKMAQRKRRDLLAKVFYAWVQVRNLGAVEKSDIGMAITYHEKRLMKKVFNAWYFTRFGAKMPIARSTSLQLITAEETYIEWLNEQLSPGRQTVNNISEALADGTLIIKAVSNASGKKPPKYNLRPKVRLHRQDNWKVAHEFMKSIGINVKGIEPADLGNVNPAAIHNLFSNILRWSESRENVVTAI